MTNVPGPKQPVYLAGTPVRTVLAWAPRSGHIGMSVSIYSYRGEVTIGLMVDAALVPDPDLIVTELERELDALAKIKTGRRGRAETESAADQRSGAERRRRPTVAGSSRTTR